jgi:hypothetical protein
MQDLLFAQLWQETQVDNYCPFSIFNASMGFTVDQDDEFQPNNTVDNQGFLVHLDHSNSSFDSLGSVSPIDGLFVHDHLLFGEIEDDLSIKDYDSPCCEDCESPVSSTCSTQQTLTFGSFQLQMTEEFERLDSEDEIQEDSEEEHVAPVSPTPVKRETKNNRKQVKTPKSPEAKVAKKPRSNGGRKKRNATVCVDHEQANDGSVQSSCCLSGCSNAVTNRLRFSLRRNYTFKNDFLEKNWNKVCTYHYFSDLYVWKKVQGANKNKN